MTVAARMTDEEFMRLPDNGRKYELVDGEAKEVPTSWEHDTIAINLIVLLAPFAKGHGFMSAGQAGFRMASTNIRCPDVSYTRKERVPGGTPLAAFGEVAPDLCIEIISPSESRTDMVQKLEEYFRSGAVQVWHIFPETQHVIVYKTPNAFETLGPNDEIDGGDLLTGFRAAISELFILG